MVFDSVFPGSLNIGQHLSHCIHHGQQTTSEFLREFQISISQARQQVLARVRHFFEASKPQESAASLDGVNRSKNAGQQFLGRGIRFQLHELLVQPVQILAALDKKILNNVVHGFTHRLEGRTSAQTASAVSIGSPRAKLEHQRLKSARAALTLEICMRTFTERAAPRESSRFRWASLWPTSRCWSWPASGLIRWRCCRRPDTISLIFWRWRSRWSRSTFNRAQPVRLRLMGITAPVFWRRW